MKNLPWHHVHITLTEREVAAKWHEQHTPAKRTQPTKRSENLYCDSNLLQIQSRAVAPESQDGYIDSIGIGVLKISEAVKLSSLCLKTIRKASCIGRFVISQKPIFLNS